MNLTVDLVQTQGKPNDWWHMLTTEYTQFLTVSLATAIGFHK